MNPSGARGPGGSASAESTSGAGVQQDRLQQDGRSASPHGARGRKGSVNPKGTAGAGGLTSMGGGGAQWPLMGPNEPTSTTGQGNWGVWGKGEPCRERCRSGGRGKWTRGIRAEPGLGRQASPTGDVTAAQLRARASPPPSHSTHQEEGQGAGSPQPHAKRRRRRWGQRTGRTVWEAAGTMSCTCPCLIPADSGCRGACQLERNTPENKPPWHPESPPLAWTSVRREVVWDGAQGGCWWLCPMAKDPQQSHPAPREHLHSDGSGGAQHVPGPPNKPAS